MRSLPFLLSLALAAAGLGGCGRYDYTGSLNVPPAVGILTKPGQLLAAVPPAVKPINVAVYDFQDLTGQNKSPLNATYAEFSRAITQGASVIVVDALKTAGGGSLFNVIERGYLDSLLRERRLIQETYSVLKKDPKTLIDPLKFAEYLVTGGVISYDAPIASASASGGYAGYAGGLSAGRDLVTVNVRLVRVRDGLVVRSINASRPILTLGASGSVARIAGRSIVEAQASAGLTEATQTAVREAIETAVYEMIRQGVQDGTWTLREFVPGPIPHPLPPPAPRLASAYRPVTPIAVRAAPEPAMPPSPPGPAPQVAAREPAPVPVPVPAAGPGPDRG